MRTRIEPIAYAPDRALPVEVLTLSSLHARRPRDLTAPERPDFHLVLLAIEGEGWHTVDFVRHPLRADQVLVVAAGQVQQFAPAGSLDARLVVVRPEAVRWRPALASPVPPLSAQRLRLASGLVDLLAAELGPDGGRSGAVAARLVEALGEALSPAGPPAGEAQQLVDRFKAALEAHFTRAHEVSAYAAILDCATKTLVRHCQAATGLPPKRLIDERLALEARRVLAHEDTTVAELAERLGFATSTQFVKFFRRVTSETPTAFRGRARRGFG